MRLPRRRSIVSSIPSTTGPFGTKVVISQRIRKGIEEGFGWIKEGALQRRARHRGKERVGWQFTLAAAAYNLIRLPKLLPA